MAVFPALGVEQEVCAFHIINPLREFKGPGPDVFLITLTARFRCGRNLPKIRRERLTRRGFAFCEARPENLGCLESHVNITRFPGFAGLGSGPGLLVPGTVRVATARELPPRGPRDGGTAAKVNSSPADGDTNWWSVRSSLEKAGFILYSVTFLKDRNHVYPWLS